MAGKGKTLLANRLEILLCIGREGRKELTLSNLFAAHLPLNKQFIEAQLFQLSSQGFMVPEAIANSNGEIALKLTDKGVRFCQAIESETNTSEFQNEFPLEAINKFQEKRTENQRKFHDSPPEKSNSEEVERILKAFRQHTKDWYETPGYAELWKEAMAEAWRREALRKEEQPTE